jgi:hypothetical protein
MRINNIEIIIDFLYFVKKSLVGHSFISLNDIKLCLVKIVANMRMVSSFKM